MARVLLCWELGGGSGHCVRLAPLAARLVADGHEVSFASRNLITAQRVFGALPVRYYQAPYTAGPPTKPIAETLSLAHVLHTTGFDAAASMQVLCAAWRSIFSAVQPAAIVFDHSPMALLASRWHAVKRIVVGTGFAVPPPESPFPPFRYWLPAERFAEQLQREEGEILQRVNDFLARDRLPPLDRLAHLYSQVDASFLLSFKELDHYPHRAPCDYLGVWFQEGADAPSWPQASGPKLFAYLKPPTVTWRLTNLLAFICESRIATLAYVPGADATWLQRFQLPHVRFVTRPVDLRRVAEQCDAAILNGNSGSAWTDQSTGDFGADWGW